jgi:hypothetical protein
MFCASVHAWHDSHFPGQWSSIKDHHNGLCQGLSLRPRYFFLWGWSKEEVDQSNQ